MTDTAYGWDDSMEMRLLDKMKADMKNAMRNKDNVVRDAIRIIMSEFPTKLVVKITLESGKKSSRPKQDDEIENDDIINIIQGLVKSEKQTLELSRQEGSEYLDALTAYMPQLATDEEIAAWVKENVDLSQFKSPMQAMGPIMKHFGKKADGNQVKQILQGMQ